MSKMKIAFVALCALLSIQADAAWGYFKTGVQINSTFYDLNPTSISPDFNQNYFGRFSTGGNLTVDFVEACTWRDVGVSNTCQPVLNYRVYRTCDAAPSFTSVTLGFSCSNCGVCAGANNQTWSNAMNANLLSGLTLPGTYVIEMYMVFTGNTSGTSGCGETLYDSNSSLNYIAYFELNNSDAFGDGNFSSSIVWGGETSEYQIVNNSDVSGLIGTENIRTNTMRLNSSSASDRQISTQIATWDSQQEWSFWLGRRGQGASDTNRSRVWLYSDNSDLEATTGINGYFIELGDVGDDEVRLYKCTNGTNSVIWTSTAFVTDGLVDYGVTFYITRSQSGLWTIRTSALPLNSTQAQATPTALSCPITASTEVLGTVIDNTFAPAANGYFGLISRQTGTALQSIEFDNFKFVALPPNTFVNYNASSATLSEPSNGGGDLAFTIPVNIVNPSGTVATSVNVVLTSGASSRLQSYAPQTVTWAAGASGTQNVTFYIDDNAVCDDIATLVFSLQSVSGGLNAYIASPTTYTLTLVDNDMGYATLLSDDFEDGNSTGWTSAGNGSWSANTTAPASGTYSLRHSTTGAVGTSSIYTSMDENTLAGVTTTWRFNLKYFNLDPSGGNKWQVFLASNNTDYFGSTTNGYAVGVNPINVGDADIVYLWRVTNGAFTPVITTTLDWGTTLNEVGFEIVRDETGAWTLYMDQTGDFDNLVSMGTGSDVVYDDFQYFGAKFIYTASNSDKLSLDDISVIQKGCKNIYYSQVPGGNFNGPIWSSQAVGTAGAINPGRFTRLVIQNNAPVAVTGNAVCNDITIDTGASLSLNANTMKVYGNWIQIGTVNVGTSTVVMKGSEAQNVLGTGPATFYKLNIDNDFGTVNLLTSTQVSNALSLVEGTLQTGGNLVLMSSLSGSGSIGPIPGTADISGNVTINRYFPAAPAGYVYIGSPISSQTLADWNDDLVTTGFPGSDFPPPYSFNNIYTYDETLPGGRNVGWTGATNITNAIDIYRGYAIYQSAAAQTVDMTGSIQKGNVNVPLSYTNNANGGDGWNLIANLYPSEIDWIALEANSSDVNLFYVYDANLPGYRTFSANLGTGSASRYIPHCQGFFVKSTGPAQSLNFMESVKTNTNVAFERSVEDASFVRINIDRNGEGDEALIAFSTEATNAYDMNLDAEKFESPVATSPELALVSSDDMWLTIDARPMPAVQLEIPVYLDLPEAGDYTISFSEMQNVPLASCLTMEDTETGTITAIEVGTEITVSVDAPYQGNRMIIRVSPNAVVSSMDAVCNGTSTGEIAIEVPQGDWSYNIVNELGTTVYSGNGSSVFDAASAGLFTLEIINEMEVCGSTSYEVVVNEPAPIEFSASSEIDLCNSSSTGSITFQTVNAGEYTYAIINELGLVVASGTTNESQTTVSDLVAGNYSVSMMSPCGSFVAEVSTIDENAISGSASAESNSIEFVEGTTGLIVLHANVDNATSVQWMIGDVVVGEGSTFNYEVTTAGEYIFTMLASNDNCSLENDVVVSAQTTVGVIEALNADITIIRRDGGVAINFNGVSATSCNVSIFNSMGQIVYEKNSGVSSGQLVFVDMEALSQGVYTVRISDRGQVLKVASVSK